MSGNFNLNDIEDEALNHNDEDSDYKDLMSRLKEIKSIIVLLEKKIFK